MEVCDRGDWERGSRMFILSSEGSTIIMSILPNEDCFISHPGFTHWLYNQGQVI